MAMAVTGQWLLPVIQGSGLKMWQKRLNKRLSGPSKRPPSARARRRGSLVHFQFDTSARVCFVCIPSGKGPE